jgi:hypothetical protein
MEKRTLTQLSTMTLVYGVFCLVAFNRLTLESTLRQWAVIMLIFLGVAVLASIIIQVLFHILFSIDLAARKAILDNNVDKNTIGEALEGEFIEDERDQLVALKSRQAVCMASGLGLILGLVSLLLNAPPTLMLNLFFASFFLGALAEGITSLVLYRRRV